MDQTRSKLQAEAKALRETAQQCLTKAESLETLLATTPTLRPYYYGQEIKGVTDNFYRVLAEVDERVYAICVATSYTGSWDKRRFTHQDGTPLGEFLMVPTPENNKKSPHYNHFHGWGARSLEHVNESLLDWRKYLLLELL